MLHHRAQAKPPAHGRRDGSHTERPSADAQAGWGNDAEAVARLQKLAETIGEADEPEDGGVHDALAAELRTRGPLPPLAPWPPNRTRPMSLTQQHKKLEPARWPCRFQQFINPLR